MDKKILLYGGLAVGAYLLLKPGSTPGSNLAIGVPGSTPIASPVDSTGQVPTTYGINSGIRGGNGSFYTVANYSALAAVNPNLLNPNYQLTKNEKTQYLANYLDLQQGIAKWPNGGITDANVQFHWTTYGCAEKRIFLPLQPPSNGAFIAPPVNPKAAKSGGGSSWIGSAIGAIATIAVAIIGTEPQLNDAECQLLFTGGYILNNILPMYKNADPVRTTAIQNKLSSILTQYS